MLLTVILGVACLIRLQLSKHIPSLQNRRISGASKIDMRARKARGQKNPPVVTPYTLFQNGCHLILAFFCLEIRPCWNKVYCSCSSIRSPVERFLLIGHSRRVEYVMDGSMDQSVSPWVSEWVSESVRQSVSQWVRDVCMSHKTDRIYYKQPIKFLVLKKIDYCSCSQK